MHKFNGTHCEVVHHGNGSAYSKQFKFLYNFEKWGLKSGALIRFTPVVDPISGPNLWTRSIFLSPVALCFNQAYIKL